MRARHARRGHPRAPRWPPACPSSEADAADRAWTTTQRTLFLGEKTIGRYGCFGCHNITGFEKANPIGVELTEEGSKLVERLDFGFEHGKIPHTLPGWVHRKVKEPRVFDAGKVKRPEELLRMPKFFVDRRGGGRHRHRRHVASPRSRCRWPRRSCSRADERYVERGARLVRDYNCRGCHQLGDAGRRHPRGGRRPARGSPAATSLQASGASRRRCSTTRTRRSARARACTPTGCTAFLRDPVATRSAPVVRACACRPSSSRGASSTPSPATSPPWTRCRTRIAPQHRRPIRP